MRTMSRLILQDCRRTTRVEPASPDYNKVDDFNNDCAMEAFVNAHLNDLSFLFVSMKAKTNFLPCIGYLSFTKDHIKQDLLQILALVLLLNFLNY